MGEGSGICTHPGGSPRGDIEASSLIRVFLSALVVWGPRLGGLVLSIMQFMRLQSQVSSLLTAQQRNTTGRQGDGQWIRLQPGQRA
jgi:hypothetical protein